MIQTGPKATHLSRICTILLLLIKPVSHVSFTNSLKLLVQHLQIYRYGQILF
jgi:hypothetical protein